MTRLTVETAAINSDRQVLDRVAIFSFPASSAPMLQEALGRFAVPGINTLQEAILLDRPQEVAEFLEWNSTGLVVLLLAQPVYGLAAALQTGRAQPECIETCLTEMRAIVELLRTDRRRILLVDQTEALRRPFALAQALLDHRALDFPGLADLPPASPETVSEAYHAFALLSLNERPEARRLNSEIAASLLPLGPSGQNRLAWEEAIEDLIRLEAMAKQAQEQAVLVAELDRLRSQCATLEGELATVARLEATFARRNLGLMKEIATLETRRDRLTVELEQAHQKSTAVEARAQKLEQEVAAVYASTSWRITAPVRAVKLALTGLRRGRS